MSGNHIRKNQPVDPDLHILQHALGVDKHGHGEQYRNRFVTGPGSTDFDACWRLCERGLLIDHGAVPMYSNDHYFVVTEAGEAYVAEKARGHG